ncbi:MAG: hypothetical protein M0Z89_00475 [Nitrospiraceae bacterium]|nr:hypothetical protein [Nitrospiraceae bacterium]
MRLLIAALSFLLGLYAISAGLIALLPPGAPEWLTGVGILIGFCLSLVLTNKLVNAQGTNFWSLARAPEPGEQPEQEGLLLSTTYQATRAFQVEEFKEEGPHYFIELHDGSVLHMNGLYLAAFEPRRFFEVFDRPRKFPCTEFVVRRDREDGCVVDIQCSGPVLEPEITTPPFDESDFRDAFLPQDGDIITTRTYDELKSALSEKHRTG